MSILGNLMAGRRLRGDVTWTPVDDFWYTPTPGTTSAAGVRVSADRALQLTTISACVKVIAETVATVPVKVYREVPAGKEQAVDDPRWRLLRRRPNRWQSSMQFREMLTGHAALRGAGYAEMVGRSFDDLELIPRHPERVSILETDDAGFTTVYGIRGEKSTTPRPVPRSKMFVLLGPWGGKSPIQAHREAIGLGLARQEYAGRFFGNGARPGGLLKTPQGVNLTPEQREQIKASWDAAHQGPSLSHKVAVMEGGLEWQQVGTTAEDSQLVESMQLGIGDMCRIWNVPPYKVQEYGRATWSNTEQMAIDFLTTCMLPWFRRWEEAITWHLIADDEPVFAEFLLEGLLRGDTAARFSAYQIATGQRPWMSPNEVRERENLNRLPGLDEVAPAAQQQPTEQRPGAPMREERDEPEASALWSSWAAGVAESLAKAEARELDRAPKDQAKAADYMRQWYAEKYKATVRARLEPMAGVWRGALPCEAAVMLLVASGMEWATTSKEPAARQAAIQGLLAEGRSDGLAA